MHRFSGGARRARRAFVPTKLAWGPQVLFLIGGKRKEEPRNAAAGNTKQVELGGTR